MRVAILNSFPNIPECAEAEWIRRGVISCERLGFDAREVVTSDDIMRFEPDCVLVTHEYSAKLTPCPTLGLNWSPPSFFADDPLRRRAVLSLDGHHVRITSGRPLGAGFSLGPRKASSDT